MCALRSDTAERERDTADTTMTAPNTYDVIVVGGGISGRHISCELCSAGFIEKPRMYIN